MLFVIVLMVEITYDPFLVPVLIIAMVMARSVASLLGSTGLYHALIEVQSLPFLDERGHWRQHHWVVANILDEDARRAMYFANRGGNWATETNLDVGGEPETRAVNTDASAVSDGMFQMVEAHNETDQSDEWNSSTLIYIHRQATDAEVRAVLQKCLPGDTEPVVNGLPVVEDAGGVLCGLVTRNALEGLLARSTGSMDASAGSSSSSPRARSAARDGLDRSLIDLSSGAPRSPTMETKGPAGVGLVMDHAPFVLQETVPVHHAHMLFRQLGVRHVVVVDKANRPRGVLTRKSLMPWRIPWVERSFSDRDTYVETRALHSPPGTPRTQA